MSLSSCPGCWDNPCTCGQDYKYWSVEGMEKQIKMLQRVKERKEKEIMEVDPDPSNFFGGYFKYLRNKKVLVIIQGTKKTATDGLLTCLQRWIDQYKQRRLSADVNFYLQNRSINETFYPVTNLDPRGFKINMEFDYYQSIFEESAFLAYLDFDDNPLSPINETLLSLLSSGTNVILTTDKPLSSKDYDMADMVIETHYVSEETICLNRKKCGLLRLPELRETFPIIRGLY